MTETLDRSAAPRAGATPAPPRRWDLDALRLLAIAAVVAIHVFGLLVSAGRRGSPQWWGAVVIDIGLTWAVPVFVMISGALVLAPRAHADGPAVFYRKRFARIVPALIVWHLVYLLGVRAWLLRHDLEPASVALDLINTNVYTALYFLWLIAGLYVVAPVLAAFLHAGGHRRALVTAGVALAGTHAVYLLSGTAALLDRPRPLHLTALTEWWPYVGLFLAGWALHRVVLGRRGMAVAAAVGTAATIEIIWQYGRAPDLPALQRLLPVSRLGPVVAVLAICVFLLAVGAGARITLAPRVAGLLRTLSDASFGVFLVHLLILQVLRQTVPAVLRADSLAVVGAVYVVVLVLSFAVSLAAARVRFVRAVF